MYKWQVLGLMWCVSSLVGEYLFTQVLPHVTSSPFVATLEFTSLLGFNVALVKVRTYCVFKKRRQSTLHIWPPDSYF